MTIQEAQAAKAKLQETVSEACNAFTAETGVTVSGLIVLAETVWQNDDPVTVTYKVKATADF